MRLLISGLILFSLATTSNYARASDQHIKLIGVWFENAFSKAGTEKNKAAALSALVGKCEAWGAKADRKSADVLSWTSYESFLVVACLLP